MINLNAIITALTTQQIPPLDVRISGAVIDSRHATEGSLFIALPGENVNGHDFVQAAFDRGASLALVDRDMDPMFNVLDLRQGKFDPAQIEIRPPLCLRVDDALTALQTAAAYWRRQHDLLVIGITGSVGKTSTKEITSDLLAQKFTVLKNPGNRNNEIGLPLTLLELGEEHDCAVLEMGFYVPGEIKLLCEIAQPQIGVVTNIGTVHAERAGSQEVIARGKMELVQSLPPAPQGTAVLNRDDPWVLTMFGNTDARVLSYGVKDSADLTASQIESQGLDGISCLMTYQGEEHAIRSPLIGDFSAYTLLRAAAVGLTAGLDWQTIERGLSQSQVDLRMRRLLLSDGVTVIDDTYNASPVSTNAALALLKSLQSRRVAILGDMLELGQYEESGHRSVGRTAAEAADVLILVGERSKITAAAAVEAGAPEENIQWFPDSTAAALPAAALIRTGDVVLVKGSNSMRMDHIIAALKERD
ncbi:MAG: UDP-N-acetylmuramoyl-tripeptide--D-alanyl-D-alanine ligase [Chloroflexota bacterium]|nr:UDP-N-acetylmuramoyl-tripeptide--D-alanyl-D-alanine ligase [Chloroflexota bacterium]